MYIYNCFTWAWVAVWVSLTCYPMTNITDVNVFPDINMYKFEGFQAPNYDRGFPNQFAMIPVRGLSILLGLVYGV
jgi:hypothetical protein